MNDGNRLLSIRACGWYALVPLFVGASICFLKYAGWSAVVSGRYGIPGEQYAVEKAAHAATGWFWGLAAFGVTAFATTLAVIPLPFESLSPGLRGTLRTIIALAIVIGGILLMADILATLGHHMHRY